MDYIDFDEVVEHQVDIILGQRSLSTPPTTHLFKQCITSDYALKMLT